MAKKPVLDKDLKKLSSLEEATQSLGRSLAGPGLSLVFLAAVWLIASLMVSDSPHSLFVIIAGVIGGYMALNIGANDVANNMGPAVGGRALPMLAALLIAAVFEGAGALIAGGDVVSTISKGIIVPGESFTLEEFVSAMMAALLAAALWINVATLLNAPVSTTHSIVGGVLGAGIAAAGFAIVSWPTMGAIAASWVISPIMGGIIAALLLGFVKWAVLYREDRLMAAKRWVPVLIGLMASIFSAYLVQKGLKKVWKPSDEMLSLIIILAFVAGWLASRPWVMKRVGDLANRRKDVAQLFNLPLVVAAALLSFAHGANDVANAVGPLAAIVAAADLNMAAPDKVAIPIWVMLVGAMGIAMGLLLFGPRLIRVVGEKITRMNAIRAYCVALSAAFTVLVASNLGLPVSSTHIAVGGIFGVGFLREFIANRQRQALANSSGRGKEIEMGDDQADSAVLMEQAMKRDRRRLVRRQHLISIGAAWIVTVPSAAFLAGGLYWVIRWLS